MTREGGHCEKHHIQLGIAVKVIRGIETKKTTIERKLSHRAAKSPYYDEEDVTGVNPMRPSNWRNDSWSRGD